MNSGLLNTLLPPFEREEGIIVRAHAAGSGRALEMLNDGVVDLVISHAPQAEARMLKAHRGWRYQKIATNEFLIVGPGHDPADVRHATDVKSAVERIATRQAYFVSRGDGSGTHERETELWNLAGAKPDSNRLLLSGSGMGATLRQADERGAYTLTDDSTFTQLRDRLALQVHFSGGQELVNSYAVMFDQASQNGVRFAAWLAHGAGHTLLSTYSIGQARPFRAWPKGCPGDDPFVKPCNGM